jgi:hypothetical protein
MACCGKNDNCAKQTRELPTDELLGAVSGISVDLAAKLLQIAAGGLGANTLLREFVFPDTKLETLAKKIADLAIENEYLRKVTDLFSPVIFNTTKENIEISFGPADEYVLKIPLTTKNDRNRIITQLKTAADKLEALNAADASEQKVLPFLSRQ